MSKYLQDIELKELLEDVSKFDSVMDRVVNAAIERVMISIPKLLLAQIKHAEATKNLADKFYADNRDLKKYRVLVGTTVTRLHSENPDKSMSELLQIAADEVRQSVK